MSNEGRLRVGDDIADVLQEAGVAGAGGAGFPSYVKWQMLDDVDALLVNHQESEPNYYSDKWLIGTHTDEFAELFQSLLDNVFDLIVIGTKDRYRGAWLESLQQATEGIVYDPEDLPLNPNESSGVVIAYTPNVYTYSEESVLLLTTVGVPINDGLPTDHGWVVHNTESLFNVLQALQDGTPVTRKYVVVDGNTPCHRCLNVPIGTPATVLLETAGVTDLPSDQVLVDGGPGWCYEILQPSDKFGVRKRTNGVLMLDREIVEQNRAEGGEIDVRTELDWTAREHEMTPTRLDPDLVRIPLISNEAYAGVVEPSIPIVSVGDTVAAGDCIAAPAKDAISNSQHASIDGEIMEVTDSHVVIGG